MRIAFPLGPRSTGMKVQGGDFRCHGPRCATRSDLLEERQNVYGCGRSPCGTGSHRWASARCRRGSESWNTGRCRNGTCCYPGSAPEDPPLQVQKLPPEIALGLASTSVTRVVVAPSPFCLMASFAHGWGLRIFVSPEERE